jgi:hypothetical protein
VKGDWWDLDGAEFSIWWVSFSLVQVAEAAVGQIQAEPPGEAVDEVGGPDPFICSVVSAVALFVVCEGEDLVLDILGDTKAKPAVEAVHVVYQSVSPDELYAWGDVLLD